MVIRNGKSLSVSLDYDLKDIFKDFNYVAENWLSKTLFQNRNHAFLQMGEQFSSVFKLVKQLCFSSRSLILK